MKKTFIILCFLAVLFSFGAAYAAEDGFIVKFYDGFVPPQSMGLEVINENRNIYLSKSNVFPSDVQKNIDKAVSKGFIKANTAARKKSYLAKKLNEMK